VVFFLPFFCSVGSPINPAITASLYSFNTIFAPSFVWLNNVHEFITNGYINKMEKDSVPLLATLSADLVTRL